MIKSSSHSTKFARTNKKFNLGELVCEYRKALKFYVNELWHNKFEINDQVLNIQDNQLIKVKFHPSKVKPITELSARALKCAMTQATAMVNAATEKRRKQLFQLKKMQREGLDTRKLQRKIDKQALVKPSVSSAPMELNSICAMFMQTDNHFDGFLKLASIGKRYGKIYIPLKMTRHSNKLANNGEMMKSFLVSDNRIDIRWKLPDTKKRTRGRVLGADQGIVTCLTLSDGQTTPKCPHGHDLHSIQQKLSNKQKGSKAFRRAQAHRKNYIHWSINQLNFNGVQELRLEKLKNVGVGKTKSRFLSHFTYRNIKDKITDVCLEHGVRVTEQSSAYRSQRCSGCGYTHKSNRSAKLFKCISCGMTKDADLNAAINHEQNLVICPFDFRSQANRKGFFWELEREPTVPF